MDHIFFKCLIARYIWNACGFNTVPISMERLCDWVMNFRGKDSNLVTAGVAAVIWSIRKTRNDNGLKIIFPMDPSFVG